jgi:hypothetical protein
MTFVTISSQKFFFLELEVAVEADQNKRVNLNSSAHLFRVFESERFVLHSPDVISYTRCGQVPHVTADLCCSEVNGGLLLNLFCPLRDALRLWICGLGTDCFKLIAITIVVHGSHLLIIIDLLIVP